MLDPSREIFWRKKDQVSVGFGALVVQRQVIGTFFNKFPERARHNSFSLLSLASFHLFNMFHVVRDMKYKHSFTYVFSGCGHDFCSKKKCSSANTNILWENAKAWLFLFLYFCWIPYRVVLFSATFFGPTPPHCRFCPHCRPRQSPLQVVPCCRSSTLRFRNSLSQPSTIQYNTASRLISTYKNTTIRLISIYTIQQAD